MTDERKSDPSVEDVKAQDGANDQAQPPGATDKSGEDVPPSGTKADGEVKSLAETLRDDFLREFGEDDDPDAEDDESKAKQENQPEAGAEGKPKAEGEDDESDIPGKDDEDDEARIPDEEFRGLKSPIKRRISVLTKRRRQAEQERDQYRKSHDNAQQLESFVKENDIEPESVGRAYGMLAMYAQGDYEGFLEQVEPWINQARQAVGQALPKDLQEAVESGEIDEGRAREIAKSQAEATRVKAENQRLTKRAETQQQATQQYELKGRIVAATNKVEADLRKDPDFSALEEATKANIKTMIEIVGFPKDEKAAEKLAREAFNMAKRAATAAAPKRAPTTRAPSSSNRSRGAPEPTDMHSAVLRAMETLPGSSN